jgi:hypothetical protein
MKIRVSQIRKGDRFFNEFWNKPVIATTDAYRLDGTLDPEHYSDRKPKPKEAICYFADGEWRRAWWMIEVGVNDGNGAGGGWSAPEYYYIEVEREEAT